MQSDFRYELKYEIPLPLAQGIGQVIHMHPQGFKKAFPDRWVNNIYYDTPNFVTCQENLDGISERKKFRLRWYGDQAPIQSPKFEIKIKSNMVGRKETIDMRKNFSLRDLPERLQAHPSIPDAIRPVIQNRYLRSYYLNMKGDFRITIDREFQHGMVTGDLTNPQAWLRPFPYIIMEVKFDMSAVERHGEVTRYIPYRQTKHSKYVSAVLANLAYC